MIWLIGNKGMLGTELGLILAAKGLEHFGSDRECDITDLAALRSGARGKRIEWIVNCSAYTAVDKAEEEEALARRINATGAENIAIVASEIGARMIHISTDYVFGGEGTRPYLEDEPVAPAGAYGRTKAEGEALVRSACPRHFILRTAWLYGRYGKNFVYTMLRLMGEKGEVDVVSDQRGSPTWAHDLAAAIATIAESRSEAYGNYHYTNSGETNWFEFAREIERLGGKYGLLKKGATVRPLTSAQYPSKVKRPSYSVLSKEKTERAFGIAPPPWQASLEAFIADLANNG